MKKVRKEVSFKPNRETSYGTLCSIQPCHVLFEFRMCPTKDKRFVINFLSTK